MSVNECILVNTNRIELSFNCRSALLRSSHVSYCRLIHAIYRQISSTLKKSLLIKFFTSLSGWPSVSPVSPSPRLLGSSPIARRLSRAPNVSLSVIAALRHLRAQDLSLPLDGSQHTYTAIAFFRPTPKSFR